MTQVLRNKKKRTVGSKQWLLRNINDEYVKKSKIDGYRSRSAYKLIEINNKYSIFRPGLRVLDLGAAPGGWSQVASDLIRPKFIGTNQKNNISDNKLGLVVAIDLLHMQPLPHTITLQKNFYDENILETVHNLINNEYYDLILSDMSPNTTGIKDVDHMRIITLAEKTFDLANSLLCPGGSVVCKIFQGGLENELLSVLKLQYAQVRHFKPKSSRPESREMYVIATHFRSRH